MAFAQLDLRVLIIEDAGGAAEWMAVLLGHSGCTVAVAKTGAEAIATAARFRPDAVLVDLKLPDMSGIEAVCSMQQQGLSPIAIAVTASNDERSREQARAAGFWKYLIKPVPTNALIDLLAEIVEARQAQRDAAKRLETSAS